MPTLAA
ncbi:hypothetical protein E2C01_063623 [Portunus trituberculatus]|nr:hypothetical protein [Portunus trituberculatus]